MIAVDTNVLVHAHRRDSPQHDTASALLRDLAESPHPWAIPWPCLHEFLAVVTRQRYFTHPTPMAGAVRQVDAWLASPSLRTLAESQGHWPTLVRLLEASGADGADVHDAKIAAICIDHGVTEILTNDSGFSAFADLPARDPFS